MPSAKAEEMDRVLYAIAIAIEQTKLKKLKRWTESYMSLLLQLSKPSLKAETRTKAKAIAKAKANDKAKAKDETKARARAK